jgi:hypothetical protein
MRKLYWFLIILSFTGCTGKEIMVTPLEIESWIDLMPSTPGYTYLMMKFKVAAENPDRSEIIAVNILWDKGSYTLNQNEIETSINVIDDNSAELNLRGVFLLPEKDIDTFDVEIDFSLDNGEKLTEKFEDIKMEKVY